MSASCTTSEASMRLLKRGSIRNAIIVRSRRRCRSKSLSTASPWLALSKSSSGDWGSSMPGLEVGPILRQDYVAAADNHPIDVLVAEKEVNHPVVQQGAVVKQGSAVQAATRRAPQVGLDGGTLLDDGALLDDGMID